MKDLDRTFYEEEDDDFYSSVDSGDEVVDDFYSSVDNEDDEYNEDSSSPFELDDNDDDLDIFNVKNENPIEVEDDEADKPKPTSNNEDILTQEEKMRYFSDKVISAIVGDKSIRQYAIGKLVSSTNPKLFRDENYILFSVIYNYRDRVKNIRIDSEFLSLYLDNNRKLVEKASGYIDIHAYGEVDGSEALGYISGVVKHFNRLCGMSDMSEAEFDLHFEKYLVVFKAIEAQKVYAQSNQILTEGLRVGGKLLVGFDDSFNYSRRRLAEIEGLVDMNQGTGFTSMNDVLMSDKEEGKKSVKIADFDKLEALTQHYGGIYTGNFYQVLAPAKAGKSKFCARVCHTTAVKYGNNVTVWAQEGGNEAWSAQMRAIHFDYTYNEGSSVADKKYGVDQDTILHDKFPSQDLKELEMTSKIDLASNTDYGVVDFIDRPFEVETFLDEIDSSVKANNSKLIIIDYLQLIGSSNQRMTERERISKAYKSLLNYCKKNNVAVLTPAQYKQTSIDELANKGDTSDAEMRTAGGGSSEVFRTPDIIFAFWASTADIRNRRMKVLSVPCRFNKPFSEIPCYMDLGTCQFVSLNE
ncbi:DnaB-like helicase C-terminal domain-containing protein [Clostridium baratii]